MADLQPTKKVTAAAGGGIGGGIVATFVVYLIGAYVYGGGAADSGHAIAAVPDAVSALILAAVPGITAYAAGWLVAEAPHAPARKATKG